MALECTRQSLYRPGDDANQTQIRSLKLQPEA